MLYHKLYAFDIIWFDQVDITGTLLMTELERNCCESELKRVKPGQRAKEEEEGVSQKREKMKDVK